MPKHGLSERDFIATLAKKHDLPMKTARAVFKDAYEMPAAALKRAPKVKTPVGVFSKKTIPAQKGGKIAKNPFTGEEYRTKPKPQRTRVKFRPNKNMKDIIGAFRRGGY